MGFALGHGLKPGFAWFQTQDKPGLFFDDPLFVINLP
jgi:hypothetical protein